MKLIAFSAICLLLIPLISYSQGENIDLIEQAGHEVMKRSASTCYYTEQLTRYVLKTGSTQTLYYYIVIYKTWVWFWQEKKERTVAAYKTVYYTYTTLETYTNYVYYLCYNGGTCGGTSEKSTQCTCLKGWTGLSCDSAYPTITSAAAESLGTFINPSPYTFTCKISEVPQSTISLTVDGTSYTEYDVREVSRTLDLEDVTPGLYQFTCYTYNADGSDSLSDTFTIREGIPAPFTQFDFLPEAGEGCNTFQLARCVDAIFLIDVSSLTDLQMDRIANLAGSLPISTITCENKYGLTVFGVQSVADSVEIASNSLFGGRVQLKSAILNTKSINEFAASDGYAAIHRTISEYGGLFRAAAQKVIIIFTAESLQSSTANGEQYTFVNTMALLADNEIELSVVTNAGSIYHYTETPANRLIGMNLNKYIGFGNFSSSQSSNIDLHVVPNPHYDVINTNAYESYVTLAWDTSGSALDISYFNSSNISYSHDTITNLFSFAVLQTPSCQLIDTSFNFEIRTLSPHFSTWTDIQPQMRSDCVDMVFLIDRSGSMSDFLDVITELARQLPREGYSCNNSYGLVAYESYASIIYVGGANNKFGTPDQLSDALLSFSLSGGTEDGYVGINEIIDSYSFRDSFDIRKHIVLFTDEDRDNSDSSLTKTTILNTLRDNNVILSVVTNGATFYSINNQEKHVAVGTASDNKVGFRTNSGLQSKIEASSWVNTTILSSTTHTDYTELAWHTGGIAFDLEYFLSSETNVEIVIPIFNTLMFSWGTYIPIHITSLTSVTMSLHVHVNCTTNTVPGVLISLIIDGQLFQVTGLNSFNISIPLSIWNGTSPNCICIAKNSIGGDTQLINLGIKIPRSVPQNLSLTPQSSSGILAEWNEPSDHETEGIPLEYRVTYQGILFDTNLKVLTTSEKRIMLTQLKPFTVYRVFIQAITTLGISNQSESVMARTNPEAPSQPPQNILATPNNSTSFLLSWSPPLPQYQNGNITKYIISISVFTSTFYTEIDVINPTYPLMEGGSYLLTNLNQNTTYSISIVAVNVQGESVASETVQILLTDFDEPPTITTPAQNNTEYLEFATNLERQLVCISEGGHPAADVYWTNYEFERISGATLTVTNQEISEISSKEKTFYCFAENTAGTDVRSFTFILNITETQVEEEIEALTTQLQYQSQISNEQSQQSSNAVSVLAGSVESEENLEQIADAYTELVNKTLENDETLDNETAAALLGVADNIIEKSEELNSSSIAPTLQPVIEEETKQVATVSKAVEIALVAVERISQTILRGVESGVKVVESKLITVVAQIKEVDDAIQTYTFPPNDRAIAFNTRLSINLAVARQLSVDNKLAIATTQVRKTSTQSPGNNGAYQGSDILIVETTSKSQISNGRIELLEKAEFTFTTVNNIQQKSSCVFLNGRVWDTEGLDTIELSQNITLCRSSHLTSFAVFVTPYDTSSRSNLDRIVLSVFSYLLVGISFIALLVSFILFIVAGKRFFKVETNIIYFNYCLSMLLATGLFLFGIEAGTFNDVICKIVAFALHYTWLSVFTWTLCNGILILFKLVINVMGHRKIYPFLIVFGWVFPLFIAIITVGITSDYYVDSSKHCFLNTYHGVIWAFIAPIIIILIINVVLLIIGVVRIVTARAKTEENENMKLFRNALISGLILSPILGLPWVILVFNLFIQDAVVEWIFILVNGLMGVVFFFVVVLRNAEVQAIFRKRSVDTSTPSKSMAGISTINSNSNTINKFKKVGKNTNTMEMMKQTSMTDSTEVILQDWTESGVPSKSGHEYPDSYNNALVPRDNTEQLVNLHTQIIKDTNEGKQKCQKKTKLSNVPYDNLSDQTEDEYITLGETQDNPSPVYSVPFRGFENTYAEDLCESTDTHV